MSTRTPVAGRLSLASALCFVAVAAPAAAQDETAAQQAFARCARIRADSERLACFDAATRAAGIAQTQAARSPGASAEEPASTPSAEDTAAVFGLEQLARSSEVEEITSRIAGTFSGWRGNTRFTLENGQVWEQVEPGRGIYRSESPRVTIRRGAMGSYLMEIEGVRRALRVRRVE